MSMTASPTRDAVLLLFFGCLALGMVYGSGIRPIIDIRHSPFSRPCFSWNLEGAGRPGASHRGNHLFCRRQEAVLAHQP